MFGFENISSQSSELLKQSSIFTQNSSSFASSDGSSTRSNLAVAWVRDVPSLWITNTSLNQGKSVTIRIIIDPPSHDSFPPFQRITLTSPNFDLFFHWTYRCDPFSFQTFVKEMEWNIQDDQKEVASLFKNFGGFVKDHVVKCCSDPSR